MRSVAILSKALPLVVLPVLMAAGCTTSSSTGGAARVTVTVVDAASRQPVPGALVFSRGELQVFRSDVHGRVSVPEGYGPGGLTVHAKNHRPLDLAPGAAPDSILIDRDEARVNPAEREMVFDRADTLRGAWGPYRANNDLLTYDLAVEVDPEARHIAGVNRITFRMLDDGDRIQLELYEYLVIDSVVHEGRELGYEREGTVFFVDFPGTLRRGEVASVDVHYQGSPVQTGRFGGLAFREDSLGNPWVTTTGASTWFPNKDQYPDEVESMTLSVTVPSELVDASNGRLMGVEDLGDGRTRYDWTIHNPINSYSISLNVATYEHFADTLGDLTLDFYALPYHLDAAKRQFAQARPMLECFQDRFGPYPFPEDGFKLIEVPYSGMEHQSAVTYGNRFANGYLERDWTGVGISPRFDFIIIHESGHEWFGNSVTARDVSDAWIQEGWTTYAEAVYVECMWGYEDAVQYLNGYRSKVGNREPIVGPTGVNHWPTQDQYFKGALFLNTLRHAVDDDETWWALLEEYALHFRHSNIWTTDVITYFNERLERDLRPVFEQYLYHADLPVLEVEFPGDEVRYRWRAAVEDFDMPLKVRVGEELRTILPTTAWRSEPLDGVAPEDWQPSTDLFYIVVQRD